MRSPGSGRERTLAVLLGAASGGLYWASIPKPDLGPVAWVCLVPLLVAVCHLRRACGLLAAFVAGVVAGVGRTYWIASTLQVYGYVPRGFALFTGALLIAYLAAYWVAHAAICRTLPRRSLAFAWLVAAAWVLQEWMQTWMLSGFPWELLGYSQHGFLPVLQLASVTGIFGLSFLVALVNAGLYQAAAGGFSGRRAVVAAAAPAVVLAGVACWGHQRLQEAGAGPKAPLSVGIVQGNVPQDRKWQQEGRRTAADHYEALTRSLPADSLDLIVLPETALPVYLDHPSSNHLLARVAALARQLGTPLLVGSLGGAAEGEVYNRAYLFDRSGQVAAHADKVHLVPFGEYLPLPWLFTYMGGLIAESGAFAPGAAHRALPLPGTDARFGVFICFESVFPQITRALVRDGATFLVTMTNDAWFGNSAAPWQHLSMAAVRAVETGRPIVRVANTGVSGAITGTGEVQVTASLFETAANVVQPVPSRTMTPYVRFGDWVVTASGLMLLGWLAAAVWRRRERTLAECSRAEDDLREFGRHPLPLPRPLVLVHGYGNHPQSWQPLVDHLRRCCVGQTPVCVPALDRELGIGELAEAVDAAAPPGEIDLVGHSMGGLVAVALGSRRHNRAGRVLTLASPLRGTSLAFWARLARRPGRAQLVDMTPGSLFLAALRPALARCRGRLYAWRADGDPVVPRDSALAPAAFGCSYQYPWSLRPDAGHGKLVADPRVIRDVIAVLQGRPASVPAPLPPDAGPA